MKTRISILAILCGVLLASFTAEKYYSLKFTEAQLNNHFANLGGIKQLVEKSNLPHQEVVFVLTSIDSLQKDIILQVQHQDASLPKK